MFVLKIIEIGPSRLKQYQIIYVKNRMMTFSTPSKLNLLYNINKLSQKDLKDVIISLDSNQITSLFRNFQIQTSISASKHFSKIGLKCNQCLIVFDNFQCKGYGKNEHEAEISSIKIIFQSMINNSYKIDKIKKALRQSSRLKHSTLGSCQSSNTLSSIKKAMKKVEGTNCLKILKKNLQYEFQLENGNKQNASKKINQGSDFSRNKTYDTIEMDGGEIYPEVQKISKVLEETPNSPALFMQFDDKKQENATKKCYLLSNGRQCLYMDLYKHSQQQIKNLNARIKLLEEQNSLLKEFLIKDLNKQILIKKNQMV